MSKNVDTRYSFRFVAATVKNDYKVFSKEGNKLLTLFDPSEFEPLRQKGHIFDDEEYAVLYAEDMKIFLICSGLKRNETDTVGRTLRFSFCKIYDNTTENQKLAWAAFFRIVKNIRAARAKVDELFDEEKIDGKEIGGFDEKAFIDWLHEDAVKIGLFNPKQIRQGEDIDVVNLEKPLWPSRNCVLRWSHKVNEIQCLKIGEVEDVDDFLDAFSKKKENRQDNKLTKIAALLSLTFIATVGGYYVFGPKSDSEAKKEKIKVALEQVLQENQTETQNIISQDVISSDESSNTTSENSIDFDEISRDISEKIKPYYKENIDDFGQNMIKTQICSVLMKRLNKYERKL